MEYRSFTTGENISLLGMGCMRLPVTGNDNSDINYDEAQNIIDAAYAGGVNYFDTAYRYHGGASELFVGKALAKYPRESYYLADKMPTFLLQKQEDVPRIFDEQLQKCGADYFDFYLCHSLDAESFATMENFGLYDFLIQKKQEGKIRHIGFSFHDEPQVLREICAAHPWEFVQIQLNYLDWEEYKSGEQYEIVRSHGFPVIIMEPVRGGQLADIGPEANEILQKAAPGQSIASWGFRYAAQLPGVITILSGMGNLAQMADNLQVLNHPKPLNSAETEALEKALAVYKQSCIIPCTNCQYCMPCPAGVSIPGTFALFNKNAFDNGMDNMGEFKKDYAAMPPAERASHCVECGQCEQVCPQMIPIPSLLKRLAVGERPYEGR